MKYRQRRTTKPDRREIQERKVSARSMPSFPGQVVVRVGGRLEVVRGELADVSKHLHRIARQPAPCIWRALGVRP